MRLSKVERKGLGVGCFLLFGLFLIMTKSWLSEGFIDWKLFGTVGLVLLSLWLGYIWGFDEGYKEGRGDGWQSGYQVGYEKGWKHGRGVMDGEAIE